MPTSHTRQQITQFLATPPVVACLLALLSIGHCAILDCASDRIDIPVSGITHHGPIGDHERRELVRRILDDPLDLAIDVIIRRRELALAEKSDLVSSLRDRLVESLPLGVATAGADRLDLVPVGALPVSATVSRSSVIAFIASPSIPNAKGGIGNGIVAVRIIVLAADARPARSRVAAHCVVNQSGECARILTRCGVGVGVTGAGDHAASCGGVSSPASRRRRRCSGVARAHARTEARRGSPWPTAGIALSHRLRRNAR